MLEVGVASGGSALMWSRIFGDNLESLIGIDVNNKTRRWEDHVPKLSVEIMSQGDKGAWKVFGEKYGNGTFDIILDDGSHEANHIALTFEMAFQFLKPGGVYLIEDITEENAIAIQKILIGRHSHKSTPTFDDHEINNKLMLKMYSHTNGPKCCKFNANTVQRSIDYVTIYPMMLAIRKSKILRDKFFEAETHGSEFIPLH